MTATETVADELADMRRFENQFSHIAEPFAYRIESALAAQGEAVASCQTCNDHGAVGRGENSHSCPACTPVVPVESLGRGAPRRNVFPPDEFEAWFSEIWAGTDNIPLPEWQKDGWNEYIEKRQLALGAWMAALESAPPPASVPDGLTVDVFYLGPDDEAFICEVHGKATVGALSEIEADIRENPIAEFEAQGAGTYKLQASYFSGQYDEYGRCEFPSCYELSFVSFTPIPTTLEPRT